MRLHGSLLGERKGMSGEPDYLGNCVFVDPKINFKKAGLSALLRVK